ncbi:hypothetical protein ACNKHK_15720 [Shigella flexneri]
MRVWSTARKGWQRLLCRQLRQIHRRQVAACRARLYAVPSGVCCVLLYATTVTHPQTMFWATLVNAMAYMPTIALSNSVSYSCLAQSGQDPATAFPPIRVFGHYRFYRGDVDGQVMGWN